MKPTVQLTIVGGLTALGLLGFGVGLLAGGSGSLDNQSANLPEDVAPLLPPEVTHPNVTVSVLEARFEPGGCGAPGQEVPAPACHVLRVRVGNANEQLPITTTIAAWSAVFGDDGPRQPHEATGPGNVSAGEAADVTLRFEGGPLERVTSLRYEVMWMASAVEVPVPDYGPGVPLAQGASRFPPTSWPSG